MIKPFKIQYQLTPFMNETLYKYIEGFAYQKWQETFWGSKIRGSVLTKTLDSLAFTTGKGRSPKNPWPLIGQVTFFYIYFIGRASYGLSIDYHKF